MSHFIFKEITLHQPSLLNRYLYKKIPTSLRENVKRLAKKTSKKTFTLITLSTTQLSNFH